MINSVKFRMGSGLSIPIYADWIKAKSLNLNDDMLIISAANDMPVDISTVLHEIQPTGFVIMASDGVGFSSITHDLEHVYNAIEFDLYRRSMTIGFADPLKLDDLDNWRYKNGIAVQLQLRVKVLEDDDGAVGLSISAKDDVSSALMVQLRDIAGDGYSIAVDDNVPTWHQIGEEISHEIVHGVSNALQIHSINQTLSSVGGNGLTLDGDVELSDAIGLTSTYNNGLQLGNDARVSPRISLDFIDNGIIHMSGSAAEMMSIRNALQPAADVVDIDSDEFDVSLGVGVIQNNLGESYLVLQAPDDVEIESDNIPCRGITINGISVTVPREGMRISIQYTLTPSTTTDSVEFSSSDTGVVAIVDGYPTSAGMGTAQVTLTCGEQSASIAVNVQHTVDQAYVIGYSLRGVEAQDGGKYAEATAVSVENVVYAYSGVSESWGSGRYITLDSSSHLHPIKIPANCNGITVVPPPSTTVEERVAYRVMFFDSTTDGCRGGDPSSGYAYWTSSVPAAPYTYTGTHDIPVDANADSFAIAYSCSSLGSIMQCSVRLWHDNA